MAIKTDKDIKTTKEVIESIASTNSNEPIIDNTMIMKMMQEMQSQLLSLKEENETLKKQNTNSATVNQTSNSDDFNKLVVIKNHYDGIALTLKLDEKGSITTLKRGTQLRKRLIEILDIVRLNPKFAQLGYFIIDDEEIVENYFPEMIDFYKQTISKEVLDSMGIMNIQQLTDLYINSNYVYRDAIIRKFISEWAKGEDINFMNHLKIKALTDASKTVGTEIDVMALINGVMERENTQKEFANR